jgi:hypothetical protein
MRIGKLLHATLSFSLILTARQYIAAADEPAASAPQAAENAAVTENTAVTESSAASQPTPATDSAAAVPPASETVQPLPAQPSPVAAVQNPTPATTPVATTEKKEEKKSWTDMITFKGDFRYRLDFINIPDNDETKVRARHRIRARLGVFAELPQDFKLGIQLASGSSQDPVSANQTLTDAFDKKPVWIDLAYGGWYPSVAKGLSVEAGKMKNPFLAVGENELIWDHDVTPEGAAVGYTRSFGVVEPLVHGGAYYIQERSSGDDSWLLGVQGGIKFNIYKDYIYILTGASYFDYTRIQNQETYFDTTDSAGNSSTEVLIDPNDPASDTVQRYNNDYNLVEGFFEVGGKIVKFPWSAFTDVVYNAAADNKNLGWLAGVSFGKCKEQFDFSVRYTYRALEADAVVGAFTDSDFINGGTDGKGHEWNVDFQIAKPLQFSFTYFFNQAPFEDGENYNRAQLDLKLKF